MGRYDKGYWRAYVPVATRRRRAAQKVAKMKKAGRTVSPIEIAGRKIATTFWGDAWCKNLEAYSDYANRLPRGRTYVRNGSVIDLQIDAGRVRALVSGSDLYRVDIGIRPLSKKRWSGVKRQCAGQIGSLVELLQGSVSKSVMEIVTREGEGLFPSPREITLSCSCPDWAIMCKHVAASLYGVGARLDHEPELLFTLRGADPSEMVETAIDQPTASSRARKGRVLATDELSSVFGIDIDMDGLSAGDTPARSSPAKRGRSSPAKRGRSSPAKGRRSSPAKGRRRASKARGAPAASKARAPAASGARAPAAAKARAPAAAKARAPAATKTARPRAAKLSAAQLERLQARASRLVEDSSILGELVEEVQLARGRLYLWRDRKHKDLLARITPLSSRSMLLDTPRRNAWTECKRGLLATVLAHAANAAASSAPPGE